ncbi:uncharacterized protein LOC117638313 [Prunus dulcis]|uniref:uncharacterized protein LOC117638313 n=1 Tax=Prunus dulcis TaxID=3755 RepID=UPI001482C5A1|nr:uncharacterized protein LOC117638313 [Prunus dulcis]
MGESNRRFLVKWFDSFVWLEYSKEKDAAFCLHCYLFKCDFDKQGKAGSDVFTEKGFKNLRKGPENFRDYVGQVGSLHNKATQHCLPFHGHDESETSSNKDNYVELLQFLADHDEKVRAVVLENAPGNLKLRGQGYDGASNMRGKLNGLKTQILREYPQAYYVHCFAYQLQLVLVAVAKGNENIATFFTTASSVVNIIGASCKRCDALRQQQQKHIMKALEIDDLETRFILGIINDWSKALQKKDQDIVNAMMLVQRCKQQSVRDDDFDDLLGKVSIFCGNNDVDVPNMDDLFVPQGRS